MAIVWLKVVSADASPSDQMGSDVTACLPRSLKRKISLHGVLPKGQINEDFQRFLLVLCYITSASWLGIGDMLRPGCFVVEKRRLFYKPTSGPE